MSHKQPRPSQRERLIRAMIELCAVSGYQSISVAQVSSQAKVSSATFYEQFANKEACLVAAYELATSSVLDGIGRMREKRPRTDEEWGRLATAALESPLQAVKSDPEAGRLMFVEALAAGILLRAERQRVVEEFEGYSQELLDSPPNATIDLAPVAIIGALRSICGRLLRTHAADELPALAPDLVAWVRSYSLPSGTPRWSTTRAALLPASAAKRLYPPRVDTPGRLPRGRHGLSPAVVARSQRTRIIHATAETAMAKGYANTTVADIVALAGISRDVFYEHFSDKQQAFLEAQQHPTQFLLDACGTAYFAADSWPERVWRGLATLVGLIAANPALSYVRLVECYAAGPKAIRRAEEISRSFGIFLEEGYALRDAPEDLPRLASQAITGAVFEIIQRSVATGDTLTLSRQLPQLVYIATAPFIGAAEAHRQIEQISLATRSPQR
jgi:AcrR family transcriptional regulator